MKMSYSTTKYLYDLFCNKVHLKNILLFKNYMSRKRLSKKLQEYNSFSNFVSHIKNIFNQSCTSHFVHNII